MQLRSQAKANSVSAGGSENNLVVRPSNADFGDDGRVEATPSIEACAELQFAYSYFKDAFWDEKLPECMIVYTRQNCFGYFAPDRFCRIDGVKVAELAMNPTYLAIRSDKVSLSTLVHEIVHVWRHYLGPLNRKGTRGSNGYHDSVWRDEMLRVGLVPSDTGEPGGKQTGYQMTHYIEEGGLFDQACTALLETGFKINWTDRIVRSNSTDLVPSDPNNPNDPGRATKKKRDRIRFTCPSCRLNAWAKPSANFDCGGCRRSMVAAEVLS